jgi:SAM-dependent methyltransferase
MNRPDIYGPMNIRTLVSLLGNGQLAPLLSTTKAVRTYYRLTFLAAGLSTGFLKKLAHGPVPLDALAVDLGVNSAMRDGLEAWLKFGVVVRELRSGPEGYALRGKLSRKLVVPTNDAIAAFVEEVALLDNFLITQTPGRLLRNRPFTLADQDGRLVARSSRLAEPFICEMLDAVIPKRGPIKLLEIGCGAAAYVRYAIARNPELTALGLELQPAVAALALENISKWNLGKRVTVEVGDIQHRSPKSVFDVATLHQNIYYFPVERRVSVLRHVRGFLKPGGRLVLTTFCQGRGMGAGLLNLWGAMTEGCGRLPTKAEMEAQLQEAGFIEVTARSLIPGEGFYGFIGATHGTEGVEFHMSSPSDK